MDDQGNNLPANVIAAKSAIPSKAPTNADDFTRTVRKRLANTTRTGQACDRCKIRCDGLSGGCSPCRQNNTECRTTDRISHRAVPRGYIEQLERKCADYEAKIKDMEALLAAGGLASPGKQSHDGSSTSGSTFGWTTQSENKDQWTSDQGVKMEQQTLTYPIDYNPGDSIQQGTQDLRLSRSPNRSVEPDPNGRPAFLVQKSGTHLVGLDAMNTSYMNSTRASALSVLGISIDLADLQGVAEPARSVNYIPVNAHVDFVEANPLDDSLQSCLMSSSQHAPASAKRLALPSKEEALMLVEWNFAATHPYLPLLHKPTFMAEFHRMYDIPDYKTSPAQLVIVHMTIAMAMYFMERRQMKPGSNQVPDTSRAYRHYHFSLSFVPLLLAGGTLEDCQALLCILMFTRGFAKPGPAYMLSKVTMSVVFELGLQRSIKKQHEKAGTPLNVLEDELRKRAFWTALALSVGISAKLNRPITMRRTDFDVEYPERIEDDYITEAGFTQEPPPPEVPCSFDVVFGLIKCAEFTIDIHSTLYCARRPSPKDYQPFVESIEAKMTAWKDGLPSHLKYDPSCPDVGLRMQSSNLMLWYHELRILLRHPSLGLSTSPSLNADNLTICVESSRTILEISEVLRQENNLDTAWYATSVPLLACMTLLFAIWEKRETVTQSEIARVKADMDLTVSVMKHWGTQNGGNGKLGDIIVSLTDGTMKMLREKHGRTAAHATPPKRVSISTKTFTPPNNHEIQQQQQTAVSQMAHASKQYAYTQAPPTEHIHPTPQAPMYVDAGVSNIPQMNHSHVGLHGGNYAGTSTQISQDSVHNAAAALAAAAAAQQPHHQQYFIPHTTAAETQYWYGAPDNWKEYLNQMTSLAGDAGGFPAMALMSLGQPGREMDGQWGFMNVYDFGNEAG
ncbi:hypothetical protein ABW19_dt0202533 [Dactylella cylindrospora]|nr:hypothetical protein ABW19_dt0202533 [Dactylella cylindrospora]